ncbi:hypothetical protein J1N10_17905 [Carboxylicivirga sp. A043]|uniref:PAS domain-containing sensor histidine kinase n=1 Tax=Carboxylicivirga litoralis TaxID=2816963 RepID=UPI0021CAE591|nr:histidine kinase [Carboxylicivirga sp. A043]MCU4157854.1 hypothetical protein [Carboxylicivirga sp. A043]
MNNNRTYKDVIASFSSVKGEVIDFAFRMITLFIGPLYAYSLYDHWHNITHYFIVNALILSFLLAFTVFRLTLTLVFKKYILLFILLYGYLYSTYNLGYIGGAPYFLILLFMVTFFYFNQWFSLIVSIALVVYYFVFMHLYTTGIIDYYAPPEVLVKNKIIWLADFNLTILTAVVTGYALYNTFKAYKQIVKVQHNTQQEFNYTLDKLPIPVAVLMEDRRIPYFNENFYNYFGYESEEIATLDQWLEKVYPDVNVRKKVAAFSMEQMEYAFKEQKQLPLEYFDFKTKTGELKSAEVHHTFHGDRAVCAFIDITERRKKRRLIIETMMQAEEKENRRIAQELHDGVGPLLSTAKIYAHSLVSNCQGDEAKGFGEKLNELLNNAIKELRNTINNISPQILQRYGLVKALESFVGHIQPITAIRFNIVAKQLNIQSHMVELAIYRSLVELINNSIKYGSPSNIQVQLETTGSSLVVKYMDDGKGFNLEEKRLQGFGISNIINRIESIGGFCNISTSPGAGVKVSITFDIKVVNNDTDSNC